MSPHEWIVLAVTLGAVVLFVTEKVSIDLVALLIVASLVLTGVLSPREGFAGFSDAATLTVAFMFVLSAALLRTGAISTLGPRLSRHFRERPVMGMLLFMLTVGVLSAFINNTPVVALLIPMVVQTAHASGQSPSKLLIPLSYASIVGGTTVLIGTSTNFVVSGVMDESGLGPLRMFQQTPLGIIFLLVGVLYMAFIGRKLLPDRREETDKRTGYDLRGYLTEIELLADAPSVGKRIMDSALVKELEMDIIEIRRDGQRFTFPAGDMVLQAGDMLQVRCDVGRIRTLKERAHISVKPPLRVANDDMRSRGTTLVELVITSNSPLEGKTLGDADLIRSYRAVPLAVRQRDALVHERLYDTELRSGDVILAEIKTHFIRRIKEMGARSDAPFAILTETEGMADFNRRRFLFVALILAGVVSCASMEIIPVVVAALAGVVALVLGRTMTMKDVYEAIDWKIYFLMAGALSLGMAMHKSGLADRAAGGLVYLVGEWGGPIAILAGVYLLTTLLTEVMSNTATAALVAPIAISTAAALGLSPMPFLMAVIFGASASFMSPIGYQTNTMIYGVGRYRTRDFLLVGTPLQLLFWLIATLLIPVFYPF
ncbi:MAG: SLC13 family permease [Flavobacteriales bacterium]|nr:SLC13 family permease [Flavobacteriales bacterium]